MSYKKTVFRCFCLILCLCMLLTGCSFSHSRSTVRNVGRDAVEPNFTQAQYHFGNTDNLIYVAKSGLIELYFDSVTYAVAVRETNTGKLWEALPACAEDQSGLQNAVVTLTVSDRESVYTLNSQDNAVAFSTASFQPAENGISITYDMALDRETAALPFHAVPAGSLYASVTVSYVLTDGALRAKVDCSKIVLSEGYTLETLTLLDFFGAASTLTENDYLFLPDGCGAMQTAADTTAQRVFIPYGDDLALGAVPAADADGAVTHAAARIPAFGIKNGNAAFLALIESGDARCRIQSHTRTQAGTYTRVGTTFTVTQTALSEKREKTTAYIGTPYTGEFCICYRFLNGKNASYGGMASACRELLIRGGTLSTKTVIPTEYLPMLLTLQGAVAKSSPYLKTTLTSYSETLEILKLLKAKSVNNVAVRYNGVLDGADMQGMLRHSTPLGALGSKKDFIALSQYVKTQQFSLYLNTDILSRRTAWDHGTAAETLFGKAAVYSAENPFSAVAGKEVRSRKVLSMSELEENVSSFIDNMEAYPFSGFCINDAGSVLYTDYRTNALRGVAASVLATHATTLSAGHKLMVDTGNIYMLKSADIVANLPGASTYPETDGYHAVPFLQMVLHGIVEYAHAPLNTQDDPQAAFLKAMEYGALPSYSWIFKSTKNAEIDTVFGYEAQINTAAEQYAAANALLGDLRDARLTAHEEIADGVYKAEYNNSIVIYFNYNAEPVTVSAITIPEKSFFRVN